MISWEDFEKVDIRSGTILEVKDFPKARKPAYQCATLGGPHTERGGGGDEGANRSAPCRRVR